MGYQTFLNSKDERNRRVITVKGEGSVSVNPDTVTVSIGVRTEDLNLQEAQKLNSMKMNDVIRSLTAMGIKKEQMKTTDFRIDPIYTYEDGKQLFQGYRVTHILSVTSQNIENIGAVIDAAVTAGANEVMNIVFSVSNSSTYYNHALSKAVVDAWNKAQSITSTFGTIPDRNPLSVSEESIHPEPGPYLIASYDKGVGETTPIQTGKYEIKAAVIAKFNYSLGT